MKVGIITFHFVPNHGAVLQCWAMKAFLEKRGHEPVVIDYRPGYHTVRYSRRRNPFRYAAWYWKRNGNKSTLRRGSIFARSFLRALALNSKRSENRTLDDFDAFVGKNLPLTGRYTSLKQLQADPPRADAYISGSDQLWNPQLLDQDYDGAYFLDFGRRDVPRVAYAVSMGSVPGDETLSELKNRCRDLTAVSLREYDPDAVAATGRDVHICIDPTLLLEAGDFEALESPESEAEPYIFVYGFEDNEAIHRAVERAKGKYACRVVNGSPHRIDLPDAERLRDYGPDRFLTLIRRAACVVTNSFHGTALSIIYRKDFVTVAHSTRGSRMTELLGRLGLDYRLWGAKDFAFERPIDWDEVKQRLDALRARSAEYLLSAIGGIPGESIPHWEGEYTSFAAGNRYEGLRAYAGFLIDETALRASASGGAATALAEGFIDDGGVVVGAAYADDFKSALYIVAENREALDRLKGSKYIPADKRPGGALIFRQVQERLERGQRVLFIGLPCDVGALKNWIGQKNVPDDGLFTVDLICHGPTLPEAQRAFIEALEAKNGSRVVGFNTRYAKDTWAAPHLRVRFESGRTLTKPLFETDLGFALKYYARPSCYQCRFKGDDHAADITLGDYWGLKPGDSRYNKNGVSILFARTPRGEALIQGLDSSRFKVVEADLKAAIAHNPMFEQSVRRPAFYAGFEADFRQNGLHHAVSHSPGLRVYRKAALKNRWLRLTGKK